MSDDASARLGFEPLVRFFCFIFGHRYRVLRRMNAGARKVGCDRCHMVWGMHDTTRSFVPWDGDLERLYIPGSFLSEPDGERHA